MLNRIRFMIVVFVLMAVSISVQAGRIIVTAPPIDTFLVDADCEQVTIQYGHSTGNELFLAVVDTTGNNPVQTAFISVSSPFSGSRTFTFPTPLEDGTIVQVVGEVSGEPILTLDKTVRNKSGIEGDTPMSLIAETEEFITVSCEGASETIEAPVGCNDGRLNQNACEPVAIYGVVTDDGVGMDVWEIDAETSVGTPSVYLSAEELADAQSAGTTSRCTIATSTDGRTGVYLLAGGEIEVIHGPDFENKFFVFTFAEYPSLPAVSTYVGTGLPSASAC